MPDGALGEEVAGSAPGGVPPVVAVGAPPGVESRGATSTWVSKIAPTMLPKLVR